MRRATCSCLSSSPFIRAKPLHRIPLTKLQSSTISSSSQESPDASTSATRTEDDPKSKASSEAVQSSQTQRAPDLRPKKTIAELDKELEEKLAGLSGDGGSAGLEYEDGKAVSMKRGVRNNMFRYI